MLFSSDPTDGASADIFGTVLKTGKYGSSN